MSDIIRIFHRCEDGIGKSLPRITYWNHEACQVMTNGDHEGRIMDYFSCLPLNTVKLNSDRISDDIPLQNSDFEYNYYIDKR